MLHLLGITALRAQSTALNVRNCLPMPTNTEHNPWKRLDSRIVYENPWIRVREDRVVRPDGREGIYGVVESAPAVGVVALTPQCEVWLVGQYRYAMDEYSWEIIEGAAHPGESLLDAAARELREEAGLVAHSWRPLGGEIHTSNSHSSERGHLFLATELSHVGQAPDPTEVLQLRCVPLPEALSWIHEGKIKDSLSIIALLLLAQTQDAVL